VLTIVDQHTREAMATEVRGSFHSSNVIEVLNRLSRSHRKPSVIQVENGSEFISRNLDAWAYREKVILDFSRPGKPTDNAFIESFKARVRAECLNAHVFESLEGAKNILTNWRSDFNKFRPHSALGRLRNSLSQVRGMRSLWTKISPLEGGPNLGSRPGEGQAPRWLDRQNKWLLKVRFSLRLLVLIDIW
jgi:transposase InsO family protein